MRGELSGDTLSLSIETSLPVFSVALVRGTQPIGAVALEGKFSRNEKLLPAVDWLFGESGLGRADLELLVVTRGPGSFTGVRIGLATAQGLGKALGIPLCAMSTHCAVAELAGESEPALVVGEAGRGEFYVSGWRGLEELLPPVLMTETELAAAAADYPAVVRVEDALREANVASLAGIRASRILKAGLGERFRETLPIYVRMAEAEVRLQKRTDA